MPRRVTVTFADGSSHVYENTPDDVTPQQIVDRATREFSKPVKKLDGGRGMLERGARAVADTVSGAVGAIDNAMQPLREAVGYDPEEQNRKTDELARQIRERQRADLAKQDGILDTAGDLFTRGMAGASAGIERVASGLALNDAERQRFVTRARENEAIAKTGIAGETTWDAATNNLAKMPGFILEKGIESLPYMATAAVGPFGALSNASATTGQIAQSRAEADGRQDASGKDVAIAAPFGTVSTLIDSLSLGAMRNGIGGGLARGIMRDAATEGLTEAVQSGIEYTGGAVGTKQGFDLGEMGSQMLQGGLVGAGVGGGFGVVTEGTKETFDAAGRIKFRRADDTRTPGPGLREQAVADAVVLTPQDLASPLDNADLAAGKAEIAKATAGKDADTALSQAGLPKVGSKVNVSNLPGGNALTGTIEDVFSDDTGVGVVVRPEGGGKAMREYLDTLNELGVSIAPSDPLAEADAIDAALAAQASAPMEVSSPLPSAGAETPSPRPSGRTPSASAGGGVNSAIVEGLRKRGFSEGQALGIAAGIHAESASNPGAKNPTSGAMGLGQWLGPRKAAIRKRFGDNPTLEQQLDFLADELRGGDAGGKFVLAENDPAKVLDAYVRKFMRPAAGAETDGDIARGMAALGQAPTDTGPLVPESTTQFADRPQQETPSVEVTAPAPDLPELYHGGREGMSLDDIQIIREPGASKQGKKGRTYGGFYATEKLDEAQGYANMAEGSTVYRVQLAPGSKVETKEGDVTRLSASTIDEYRSRGVDVVVGKDPRGRTEYVVINKDAVTGLVDTKNTAGPQDGGVAPTVKAPKAGGSEAIANDSAASAGGAVTQVPRASIPARKNGKREVAVTATGSEIPVDYAVVEMGDLVASNTPDGDVNPAYPADRQPRDRTRAASQTQIAEIASRLNPRLLGRSPKASDGAPIISPDGIVESGNGRTLALQRVYGENGANAQAYRQFIESEGFDTSGMKQPVLVRIRDGNMSAEQVQEFVRAANVRDTAGMSGTETAGSDAAAMPAQMVDLYRGGDIEAAGNRDFVKAFVNALVPTNERASMILADGSIAKGLVARMEAALLVRAFGQRPFIEKIVDATDSNIRAIGKALVEMAGKFAKLREAAQDERVDPVMDITGNIAEAVEIIDRARREGKPIGDYVNQRDIFSGATVSQMTEASLRMFFARPDFTKPHGQAKLVSAMDFYFEEAMKAAPGGGLFGESTKATPDGILNLANERNSRTQPADADLFSAARQPGAVPDGESVPDAGRDGGLAGEGLQTLAREEGGSSSEPVEPTDPADTPAANTPARIDDFGEQLVGARKDVWQSYKDRLNDAAEIDVTAEPLSKTWPEPDYQKLLDAGADPYVVAWVHAARDEIPTKPQKGWKLKGWAENVRLLRDTATKLLNDEIGADALVKRMSGELSRSLRDLQGRVDLYRDMGHSKSLKGITFSQNYYSLYRGERDVTKWVVEKRAKATAFGNWPREIAVGDTREEALAKFKAIYDAGNLDGKQDKIVRFDIYSRRGEPGFMIGKKIGKDYVDLKRFGTAKEARDFKISDAGYAELVAALEQYKDIPPERKASNAPRIGIDHRSGADVTPEAFAEAFGFRGVQFGNYVEGERRQSDLNEAYDALMDLAGVIGIPARALSLNGELGLAFGARGKGGKGAAAAHFEPDTIVINLTKNKGAGSLAHEWWHSLDNYFSRMRAPGGYMTEGKITATDGVRPEMVQAFKDVMTALRSTSLKERSKNLDKRRTKEYWATDIEMSARAFESYVIAKLQDEQFSNDYLANVVSEKAFGIEDGYPYLRAAELPPVRAAFDEFFNTVETRETEHGLALRSLPEGEAVGEATDVKATLREQLANLRLADKVKVRLVDTLGGAAGEYRAQIVTIAQDTPQGEVFTLNHEAIHALRDLGLFNTSEWAILSAKAKRETGLMRSIRQRYEAGFRERGMSGPALQEALLEEAVADMFARHQDGRYKAEGTTDRLFKMLRQFFEAVRNAFAGRGLRTAEGVMQDVAAGEVGGRNDQGILDSSEAKFSIPERDDLVALGGTEPTWKGKAADAFDRWRTAMQDRYLPLLKVQRQIEEQTGKPLPVSRNPYMGEELMTGRIGARLERLAEDHVQPLFDAMHAEKVTTEELESFLYARHAPERNARIAEINPEFTEGEGSGMTDLEAAAIMSRVRKAGKMEAMERLAKKVDQIRDDALDYRVQTGLISKEDADEWRSTYQFYVPLRGFKETGTDAIPERMNRSGGGINVRGRESKQAFGRRSQADSPLAYLILQAEEAIIRGETNIVAARFYNLAKANPDKEFWSINKPTVRQRMNEESGLVESYTTYNLLAEDKDWTVSAKINGREVRVTMNKQNVDARRLADAMRNLTQHQLDWVTLHMGKVNRFLSAVNTSYNPEFIITNAFRDLQTATFNLSGEGVKGIVRGTLKDYRKALAASAKGAFGKHSGEWGKWYDEFVMNGGRVYFNKVENVEEIKKRIASAAEMAKAKAGEGGPRLQAKRLFLAGRDMIENLNNGVENAVRLSVYKNAREAGLTPAQAASMAKNVTVNFNRRGTAGPAMNAAYLFFNASVQGSARILMALRSPRVRKMVAGVMIAAAAAEILNAMMSADDDDGESIYDKIPAFEKSRNIILMMPDGKSYIKIPMPYGYNAFWEAGRSAAEIARRGGDRWLETMGQFVGTVADAFNPIGGSDSLLNILSPTITDPIVDLTLNKDFTGKPIMPNQSPYGPEEPDNQRYFNSVGPHWKTITEFLNASTGGDEVQPGAIDVSPETLEYLSGTVIGSAGAFLDRSLGLIGKSMDESEDITADDIPVARKVVGGKPSWVDKSAFYDRLHAVETAMDRTEKYLEAGNQEAAYEYAMDNKAALMLEGAAKQARKDMREVRKARNELEMAKDRDQIDDATYRDKKAIVRRAEELVTTDFNAQWVAVMKARRDEGGGD